MKSLVPAFLILLLCGCSGKAALRYSSASNSVTTHELQAPLTPEETRTHLEVPNGFDIHVFAHEPDIVNPIALTWDERGRLWVVESTNYPHDHVGEEFGTDRITICEDTDGDYRADRFIRFAENLPLTTGIALVKGGAIVGQAPDLVFLEDTDGDDRADEKHVIVDNAFGTYDTHAVMNNLKIGIDNFLWGAVGYSGLFEPGRAPDPEALILRRGVFRVRTDGTDLEPVAEFNNNTWGLGIGEDNTIYGSTANNNHAIVVGIPLRHQASMNVANVQSHYLIRHSSPRQLQQVDFRDGYTAAAGAFPYNGRRFPPEYWGTLMVTEPTAHVVHVVKLEPDGSIEKESEGEILNILASSDEWVAPVFADIGPDENLWVADWYNPVIQHNPDRRGMVNQIWNDNPGPGNAHLNPLRDREHGRIYVITSGESSPPKSLSYDDPERLLEALQSTNQFWRLTAQRMLVESAAEGLEDDLIGLVTRHALDETGFDPGAVHALWVLKGLGAEEALASVSAAALTHPSPAARKAGIQTLPPSRQSADLLIQHSVFQDDDLSVRLSALLAAEDFGGLVAHPRILTEARKAVQGGDAWLVSAYETIAPIGIVQREPDPVVEREPQGFPPARLTLTAPDGLMRFDSPVLKAFVGQEITVDFANLHPDLHNAVFLDGGVDVPAFGQDLDSYMTDPSSSDTEYIPPARADQVLGSTGVLSQGESASTTIGPLSEGTYTFLCTVPGHWALMQGTLEVLDPPILRRNDAGWTWTGSDVDLAPIVYLAGSASRSSQSHYHARVFGFSDGQILFGTGDRTYVYTETSDEAFEELLTNASLLALANNKPVERPESRQAIMQHVETGRPLMITHPASWYNWEDWPAYNEMLVGGGARSHEPLQTFSVEVLQPNHPLVDGVPNRFEITDELYRAELLPDANANILAIGRSHETNEIYPVIWVRQVGDATIVVNTLGHDDRAHNLAAYKRVIANARTWLLPD
ncbi:MAG: ThuA domain-containing protein [Bacteroidetes bacterium]|nr:ThuA domain-containing protein [Bacteroidota bacterium]